MKAVYKILVENMDTQEIESVEMTAETIRLQYGKDARKELFECGASYYGNYKIILVG